MRALLSLAFATRKHLVLMVFTFIAMFAMTLTSQAELFSLRILTAKGPDFFELFGPIEEGKLLPGEEVTRERMEERWSLLDKSEKGYVNKADTDRFMDHWRGGNFFTKLIASIDKRLQLLSSPALLAAMLAAVALFKALALFTHRYTIQLVAIRISRDLRQQYFEHLQAMPMSFFHRFATGNLSSRVLTDATFVADGIQATLMNYIQMPFTVVTTLTLCFVASWQLSSVIFVGLPLLGFPIIFLAKKVRRATKQFLRNQEHFASVLIDFLNGIQTVKVFAMEDFSLKKYQEKNEEMTRYQEKTARYDISTRPITHSIATMFLAGIIIYGLYFLHMSLGEVLFYCGLLMLFYEPIKKFAEQNAVIMRGVAAAERMQEVLAMPPQITDSEDAEELQGFNDVLEFDRVWFAYHGENWILKDLSFTVKKGQMVALVGATGSGKSTIVNLMPRLYEIQKGAIRIDGKPIQSLSQRSLREQISFVPQKPFFFLDSVAANISCGRPYSDERIRGAARRAHAEEFIVQLDQQYDTQLEEAAKNLSGGQQQRLAIARALAKQAPILVMDEATSSLDAVSENKIKEATKDLRGEVTQIIVAHRLSTIEDADKIIFLEQGRKVAEGTKDELMQTCPGFRFMWESLHQSGASV